MSSYFLNEASLKHDSVSQEFQKKVLMDEAAMEDDSGHTPVDRLLTRV